VGKQSQSNATPSVLKRKTAPPRRERTESQPLELDRIVHERLRLGILSALAVNAALSFNDLKKLLSTTDGNLSVHARKLEDAGYVTCEKSFQGRMPKSEYKMTAVGRKALEHYLEEMEQVIKVARKH
jgi:DNA-binding HxlR family transcriptional regulator